MSRFQRMRRRLDPRRLRLGERPINASAPPGPKPAEKPAAVERDESAAVAEQDAAATESTSTEPPAEKATAVEGATEEAAKPKPRRRRRLKAVPAAVWVAAGVLAVAGVAAALLALDVFDSGEDEGQAGAPAPTFSAGTRTEPGKPDEGSGAQAAEEIGFPAFATKNTTRVGGSDPAANAAGVALATYPSAGGVEPPIAVSLVGEDDWAAGVAAAVLMAEPLRAPILISSEDSVPDVTAQALDALSPRGSVETDQVQAYAIGGVAAPGDLEVRRIGGRDPAATAAAIEKLHDELVAGRPDHIVVTSSQQPGFAVPAAAWAARSGDPVLFATRERLPKATAAVLKRHKKVPVYVLGPSSAISSDVLRRIAKAGGPVRRVGGEDPVTNAVDFARYADGSFGWNINDPGHGFVIARSDRPLDAVAAAPLSASGTWGPLLLTDSPDTLPGALRGYLLDVKPGYRTDPTRALYNHVWVIGDEKAIDVNQQASIDDLAELTRIQAAKPEPEKRPTDTAGGGSQDNP